jgi:tetratricopeptide (TPR) repeat protein
MYGQVIGIASLQAAEGQSLNFAVPSERILQLKVSELQTVSSLTAETQKNKRSAAERYYSQGVAQLSRDDYSRAVAFFERATELDANYPEAWYQAGFCYGLLGRHQDALKASKNAARLRPEWAEAHVNIGASSYQLGQFKEAVEAYKAALRLDDTPETQYALGLTFGRLNRTEEEILAYRRAIAMRPDHANALEKLGAAYFKQKRWADSASTFDQLKTYKPDAKTYNALGESYLELNKPDDSLQAFNSALGYDPEFDKARYNLGRTYLKLGNNEMARVQYEILKNARSDWADRLYVLIEP